MEQETLSEVKVHSLSGTRWFRNTDVDLLVEVNNEGEIINFTFSYRKRSQSLSLEWDGFQLRSFQIDDGEPEPQTNSTPIVTGEYSGTPQEAYDILKTVGAALDAEIFDFVASRIAAKVEK